MNPIMNNTINNTSISDPWVESGAMVYVALTVATLSAVIMCCTWFVKQRLDKNGYGTLNVTEPSGSADDEEEDIPLVNTEVELADKFSEDDEDDEESPPIAAFTLDDSSSDDEVHVDAV